MYNPTKDRPLNMVLEHPYRRFMGEFTQKARKKNNNNSIP